MYYYPMSRSLKITVAISLSLLGLLAFLSYHLLDTFREALRENTEKQQFALVTSLAHELDDKLEEQVAHVAALARSVPPQALKDPERAQAFLQGLAGSPSTFAKGFSLYSPQGRLVAEHPLVSRARRGGDFSQQPYLLQALASGKPAITGPYRSPGDAEPTVMVAVPVLRPDGSLGGVLGGAVGLWHENFLEHLSETRIGAAGYLYLFSSDRTMVMHPDRSRILKRDVPPGANTLFDRAAGGFEGSGVTTNSRGLRVLASFKRLQAAPWVLAANFPVGEAYAGIPRGRAQLALGISLVLAATGAALFFIFRHMKQEVARRGEAEEYANLLIETARDGVIGVTASGRIRFANRAALQLLGYGQARELLGQDLHALVHHSHADGLPYPADDCPVRACALRGESIRIENETFWRRDGSPLPVNYHCAPVLRGGVSEGVVVTFRDITERRRTAEQLRLQSAALQAAANGIVITDREGTILWVNASFCGLTGYRCEELLGQNTRILKSGLQDPALYRELWDCILAGNPWRGEWINQRRDGSSYSEEVTITPVLNDAGVVSHFIGIKQDITERKRTEAALKTSKEQLSLAIEGSGIGLWDWDIASGTMYFNERWAAIAGYTVEDLASPSVELWRSLCHPDDLPLVDQELRRHFAGETPNVRFESRLRHKDGHYVWTATRGRVQRDPEGRPLRMAGTQLDISTRKLAEETLRESNQALEETNRQLVQAIERANELALQAERANAAKSQFLANMSHEIRTPMQAIIGASHLLQDTRLAPKQESYLRTISGSATSLLGIINDILDFSKIEAGMLDIRQVEFSLKGVIREVEDLFAPRIAEKGLELRLQLPPEVPDLLVGDPLRLSQILSNLVGNAVKFTRHGFLALSIAPLSLGPGRAELEFTVKDTGLGIPAEEQAGLFHPFKQVDGSTTRSFGGTGLGLAICRQLTALMGGEIGCESTPGVGSSFSFRLPFQLAAEASRAAAGEEPPREVPRFGGERILLVEDNEIIQMIALEILQQAGLQVSVAVNGAEALAQLREGSFDLVLMDGQMPVMDGLSATRAIRAGIDPVRAGVPVVVVTANAMEQDVQASLAAGANDHLAKPFTPLQLLRCIGRFITPQATVALEPDLTPDAEPARRPAAREAAPGAEPGQGEASPLDVGRGIRQIGGSRELYLNLLRRFRAEYRETPAALAAELARGNLAAASLIAHSVKGIAGVLAALPLQNSAAELERAISAGGSTLVGRLEAFRRELDRVLEALSQEIGPES